jgi:predicted alpha-1,6-mannanase (GH76 family)
MSTLALARVFRSMMAVSTLFVAGCAADRGESEGAAQRVEANPVPTGAVTGGDFRHYADAVAARLQGWYRESDGIYRTAGWWNNANAVNAVADYMKLTGSTAYRGNFAKTFDENSSANFLNEYYDDEGWWALAWIDVYDLTNEARYLAMAKTIFADMAAGWDSTCNGGIWWRKQRDYKNAIANELFFEVAVRLHLRTPGDAGPNSFIDWATREWAWFEQSGMINGDNLINDGLRACKNNHEKTWTYNQGVVLGALVDMTKATGDSRYLTRAQSIADAAITKLVDSYGILNEGCEPNCGGDGSQFKGIFMRNLADVAKATNEVRYRQFIAQNADSIWNNARSKNDEIGVAWHGPFDTADASRQSSALDALNAAIPYSRTEAEPR